MSCRPIVSTSSTVRSPITSRITLSERSRNVFSGSRAPNRYVFGSVIRYCTTQGTGGVEIARDHGFGFLWFHVALVNISRVGRGETELEFQQPLRRHDVNLVDIGTRIS